MGVKAPEILSHLSQAECSPHVRAPWVGKRNPSGQAQVEKRHAAQGKFN